LRRDARFRRLLALADVLAAAVAIVIAGALVEADLVNVGSLIGPPLIVFAAKTLGLYDRDELVIHKTTLNDAPKLFYVTTLFTLVYSVIQADMQNTTIATSTILVLWALLFGGVLAARWCARRIASATTPPERCVLVGDTAHAQRVKRMLESHPTLSAELVAVIPFRRATARGEDAHEFGDYLHRSDFHRVIVTHTDADAGDMIDTIRVFKSRGIKVSVLPTLFDVLGSAVEFDDIGGATLLGVRRYGLTRSSELMKRALDIVVSAALLLALAPLFAVIAIQRRGGAEDRAARPQRNPRPLQDLRRPAHHGHRPCPPPLVARRAAPAPERPPRRDEPGRTAAAGGRRGRPGRRMASEPARSDARDDGRVADPRQPRPARGHGLPRLPLHRQLVAVVGRRDPAPDDPARPGAP
jgi:hypothetical protein